ncbi:MAG: hypothetical protein CVU60_17220 [Deltaproteobacteria bacterium HGW-Deltaproteobacteria-18]|nr:MAG: hypothetical protein CVU60_17220 [Deltaproteobacteria bacterium HGW-Deltaproteobacteria-18]
MAENAARKQRGKPFKKGQSGNPAGKRPGTRNRATQAVQELLDGEVEALTRKAVDLALAGDTTALRLCLERLCPPTREKPISPALPLPNKLTAEKLPQALEIIVKAVASGDLLPGEGQTLTGMLNALGKALELAELEKRVAALEGRKETQG